MFKYFVVYGILFGGLNCVGVSGGECELCSFYFYLFCKVIREIFLWVVMICYSVYDGVLVIGFFYYMIDIFWGELGFKGYVYFDWGLVECLMIFYYVVGSCEEVVCMVLMVGVDLNIDLIYEILEK